MAFSGDYMSVDINKIVLRLANENDAEVLALIYKPYVENTAVSFEYDAPNITQFAKRISDKLKEYPFIVAEYKGEVVGYTYASEFLPRPAYKHSVETTLYIKQGFHGKGIGKKLYLALEEVLKIQNVISLNACIAFADSPDDSLNNNSMTFHSKMGYRYVGRFNASGYKFNRFYDMIWMEKLIAKPAVPYDDFIPFPKIFIDAERILAENNTFYNKTVN
mgnify:CR=1 FL=1